LSCSQISRSKIENLKSKMVSSNHPVRPRQHIGRNRYTDLLRGFEVDNQLKFCRLLYSNIIALYAIDDFVHISSMDVRHNHSAYMTKAAANIPTYARTRFKLAIATMIS